MSDVVDRVKKIVVEQLSVDEGKVTDNANFIDDPNAPVFSPGVIRVRHVAFLASLAHAGHDDNVSRIRENARQLLLA